MNTLKWGPKSTDKVTPPDVTVTSLERDRSSYDRTIATQNGRVLTLPESLAVWQDREQYWKVKGNWILVDQEGIDKRGYCEIVKNSSGILELREVSDTRFKELESTPWLRAFIIRGEPNGIFNGRVAVGFNEGWGLWISTSFQQHETAIVAFVATDNTRDLDELARN